MSRKFYVLFSLKEVFQPKILKTKPTVEKYLKGNANLDFRQFGSEKEAMDFYKKMEEEILKKITGVVNPEAQREKEKLRRKEN